MSDLKSDYEGLGRRPNPLSPSLDRIEPKGGYTKTNTRIVVFAINIMLSDWGEGMFKCIARHYAAHQKAERHRPAIGANEFEAKKGTSNVAS